ncbi:MAG: hypothetical protein U1F43_26940 [Myxococcota bacterium]
MDVDADRQRALDAVVAALDMPAEGLKVTMVTDAGTDDLRFFEVEDVDADEHGPGRVYAIGALVGPERTPELARERLVDLTVRALGASGSARTMARTFALLESADEPVLPILEPGDTAYLLPEWLMHVTMPAVETAADGSRVYSFWLTSGVIPLWRVVLTVAPDGSHDLDATEIDELVDDG